jgi:hypothetical protein
LFLFRDPAEWLWARWNFWWDNSLDAGTPNPTYWAEEGEQYRSPELFHEIIASATKTTSGTFLLDHRTDTVMQPRLMVEAFGRENVFFGRNEDMLPDLVDKKGGFLDKLSSFTGLGRGGFPSSSFKSIHNCDGNKGNSADCGTQKTSSYAIAGHRAMLPETRQLIYLHFQEECKLWKEEFGIEYPDCLNAVFAD